MTRATAKINGVVVADADKWEFVEGNVYFPSSSVKEGIFSNSNTTTHCPWKGDASYYNISLDGKEIKDGAWWYPQPFEKATHLKDHVAFYKAKGIDVQTE